MMTIGSIFSIILICCCSYRLGSKNLKLKLGATRKFDAPDPGARAPTAPGGPSAAPWSYIDHSAQTPDDADDDFFDHSAQTTAFDADDNYIDHSAQTTALDDEDYYDDLSRRADADVNFVDHFVQTSNDDEQAYYAFD
jgi:hypothetical protein